MKYRYTWSDLLVRLVAWTLIVGGAYFLLTDTSRADDYHVVDLKELSLDYKNFQKLNPNGTDVMTWPDPPKESVFVNINTDVFTFGYWNSTIESWTSDSQYRGIGLETRLGIRLTDYLEAGIYHHSQHELDRANQLNTNHFLEEDAVEIRIYLYRQKDRQSIF